MPLSLTCDCGARFEVEDALAGQTVSCPECQTTLKAPATRRPVVRTSNFALASFILAIVGAFTVVGTIAAAVLGLIGVGVILRDRERHAGLGFAVTGVVLGVTFTALTIFGLSQLNRGIHAWWSRQLAAEMDGTVDVTATTSLSQEGFSITKLPDWGQGVKEKENPLEKLLLPGGTSPHLIQPGLGAIVGVEAVTDTPSGSIDEYLRKRIMTDSRNVDSGANANANLKEEESALRVPSCEKIASSDLPSMNGGTVLVHEVTFEIKLNAKPPPIPTQDWTMLIRTYQTRGGRILFIVRAIAETARFDDPNEHVKDELVKVLDTFKVAPDH